MKMALRQYGISEGAALEMKALRLTIGDVALILCCGRKQKASDSVRHWLEQGRLTRGQWKKLRRIWNVEVVTVGRCVERVSRSSQTKESEVSDGEKRQDD